MCLTAVRLCYNQLVDAALKVRPKTTLDIHDGSILKAHPPIPYLYVDEPYGPKLTMWAASQEEVPMRRFQLDEKEVKILNILANRGTMSPSQVAAETWILPGDMRAVLQDLSSAGFVLLREDTNSPDGWLVTITHEARGFLNGTIKKL